MNIKSQKKSLYLLQKKRKSVLLRQEKSLYFYQEPYETRHDCHS